MVACPAIGRTGGAIDFLDTVRADLSKTSMVGRPDGTGSIKLNK